MSETKKKNRLVNYDVVTDSWGVMDYVADLIKQRNDFLSIDRHETLCTKRFISISPTAIDHHREMFYRRDVKEIEQELEQVLGQQEQHDHTR